MRGPVGDMGGKDRSQNLVPAHRGVEHRHDAVDLIGGDVESGQHGGRIPFWDDTDKVTA